MQFRIHYLFGAMLLVATLCGLVFAAPPIIGTPVLAFFLVICPAIWFAGAIFARGWLQAFFIGGIAGGAVPYTFCIYIAFSQVIGFYYVLAPVYAGQQVDPEVPLWAPAVQSAAWMFNLAMLIPGPFSFAGGGLSVLVYRLVAPRKVAETPY